MKFEQVKLNSARNCLKYIVRAYKIKQLYLPYYLCPAVRICIAKENCELIFYHIDKNFMPTRNFERNAFILYPNYFGICSNNVDILAEKYKNLIVDNAHAFFSEPKGIASFNSVRKFFPEIRNGAFLYTKEKLNENIQTDEYEYEYKKLTFEEFCRNENRIDSDDIKYMSKCSIDYFLKTDTAREKLKIKNSFEENRNKYEKYNMLKINIKSEDIPYKYPCLFPEKEIADKKVKELKEKDIVIFRYWNNMPDNFFEKIFYERLVVL